MQMFEFLYKAQEGINYDFIYYAYSFSVLICIILLVLESFKIDAVQGYWIVFAPFLPCWFWAFSIRNDSRKTSALRIKTE
jgi:hypothetical protein